MPQKKHTKAGKLRWVGRFAPPGGKEISRSFDTRREAKAWEDEQSRAVRRGEWLDPADEKITVGEIFQHWINRPLKKRTKELYEYTLAEMDPISGLPARKLVRSQVDGWHRQLTTGRPWRGKKDKGVSEKTARRHVSLLSSAYGLAVEDGLVASNPVRIPKLAMGNGLSVKRSEIPTARLISEVVLAAAEGGVPFINQYEKEAVTKANKTLSAMIYTGAASGLRISELCGLVVGDVDFLRRRISVEYQLSKTGAVRVAPKTAASVRQVPVAADLLEVLDEMCAGKDRDEPVFTNSRGTVMTVSTATHGVKRASQGRLSFHRLRHFYASALISAGVPVTGVQAALGHASAALTLTVYTHLWPGEEERTRQAIKGILSGDGIGTGSESREDAS